MASCRYFDARIVRHLPKWTITLTSLQVDSCSSTEQQTEQYPEQQGPVAAADEDINIVDDIEDEVEQQQQPDSDAELNKSFEEQVRRTSTF